jgi:hypothetical protein
MGWREMYTPGGRQGSVRDARFLCEISFDPMPLLD